MTPLVDFKNQSEQESLSAFGHVGEFERYVRNLPQKRKHATDKWQSTQIAPCPLLYRCSACSKYYSVFEYYVMSPTGSGRQDALGKMISSRCKRCHLDSYFKMNQATVMWHSAKRRAKQKGIEFTIVPEDIKIPEFCPVLGIKMTPVVGKGRQSIKDITSSPTLERIDDSRGYTKENICVICHRANRLKGNATLFELKAIASFTERIMKERGLFDDSDSGPAPQNFTTSIAWEVQP